MSDIVEPSAQIESLLAAAAGRRFIAERMRTVMRREYEFPSALAAKLTAIALDPRGRDVADSLLDASWSDGARQANVLNSGSFSREVIIGSGFHAAVYASVRVLSGHPKPIVLERSARVGGTFAMTARPAFHLNSRNRAGTGGPAGDQDASLNYLPGAPIQAANMSMQEYQTNTDMAFVIRLALAQFAEVVTNANVQSVSGSEAGVHVQIHNRGRLAAGRVIDARGLGDPIDQSIANGTTIVTFPQFMRHMSGLWPLRGLHRVAVVGGGDAAKCAVESFLGIAPPPFMAAAALDSVDRIDWYATDLPTTCQDWQRSVPGRYQAIGRYLRPDRLGLRRLNLLRRRAHPLALPSLALIDGCTYDLVVLCTGSRERDIEGLVRRDFEPYATGDEGVNVIARRNLDLPVFQVGPHARLPFTAQEITDGIAEIKANAASMFRTAGKTAALAGRLRAMA